MPVTAHSEDNNGIPVLTQPEQKELSWTVDETPVATQQEETSSQKERLLKVMEYVSVNGSITNSQHRTLTGVSDRTATRDLEALVERGRLRSFGKRRSRRYELS
ncbi:hypothetical protein [Tengunoibacter tsumagoiensis]|nr:hypothetical protein [Tengunoibacter tsumagoiensis]